jgi:hypothetical protein
MAISALPRAGRRCIRPSFTTNSVGYLVTPASLDCESAEELRQLRGDSTACQGEARTVARHALGDGVFIDPGGT